MRVFVIEAYGDAARMDGAIHRFEVHADSAEDAITLVRASELGRDFSRFDVVDVGDQVEGGEAEIVDVSERPSRAT